MKKTIRTMLAAAAASVLIAGVSGSLPAQAQGVPESDEPIKLALNEWTGQHISTYVAGELLKQMGYNVEYVTAGYYPQMTALTDGTIDATLEIWSSNIGEHYQKSLDTGQVAEVGDLGLVPVEAWFYPDYVADMCPGLPDWEALKNCSELFATADTFPSGRFVDYPPDWGTTNVDRMRSLGLDYVNIPAGSEGAMVAEIESSVANKKPLVMQFWAPHWVHSVHDMTIVALPPHDPACYDDPSWGLNPNDVYDCDWERGYIKKMVWLGMEDKWPAAFRFLHEYTLTNGDQEPMMKAIDVDGRDIVEVVQEWIENNADRWKPWVDKAMM
jgi:glycine betaine/proline transport system substrate-binding protein